MTLFDGIFRRNREESRPKSGVVLVPLTPEMERAFSGPELDIACFPFRVGREERLVLTSSGPEYRERGGPASQSHNHLDICDDGPRLHISRAHFEICLKSGRYELIDRNSTCGTLVNNVRIGGGRQKGGRIFLEDGNVVIVGTSSSPFIFRFEIRHERQRHQAIAGLDLLRQEGILSEDTYENRVAPLRARFPG